jgi:hypothetical protein
MRIRTFLLLATFFIILPSRALAAEYADFLTDLAGPYAHYRQSLVLTSNSNNIDKAMEAIVQFRNGWKDLVVRYAADPPQPFAKITDYSNKIQKPLKTSQDALDLIKSGKVAQAHTVLEEVRYLLWSMRVDAGIHSIADKANDFHEAMEIILDQAAAAKSAEDLRAAETRYGEWLAIKWEEHALAADLASVRRDFDIALADGRSTIVEFRAKLRSGNIEAAKKMAGAIKNAYKKMWALDPR